MIFGAKDLMKCSHCTKHGHSTFICTIYSSFEFRKPIITWIVCFVTLCVKRLASFARYCDVKKRPAFANRHTLSKRLYLGIIDILNATIKSDVSYLKYFYYGLQFICECLIRLYRKRKLASLLSISYLLSDRCMIYTLHKVHSYLLPT